MPVRPVEEIRMKYLFLFFLFISAVWDMRTKRIPAIWLYGGLAWMGSYAAYQLIQKERGIMDLVLAVLPGILCYFFAKASHAMGVGMQ